jgi:hypothetical protein
MNSDQIEAIDKSTHNLSNRNNIGQDSCLRDLWTPINICECSLLPCMEDCSIVPPSTDNPREILGFVNYQLTQQAKEISILNRRVADLMQSSHSEPIAPTSTPNESIEPRLASLEEKVDNILTRLEKDIPLQIRCVELQVDEHQYLIKTATAAHESLDQRVAQLREICNQRETNSSESFDRILTDIAILKHGQPLTTRELRPLNITGQSGSRLTFSKTTPTSQRRTREKEIQSLPVVSISPSPLSGDPQIQELASEMESLKKLIEDRREPDVLETENRAFLERSLFQMSKQLESCAKKNDLYELMQCFIASGADGVFEFATRRTPGKPIGDSRPLIYEPDSLERRPVSAKVTVISGEVFSKSPRHSARIVKAPHRL